jgi:hypothetical protein
MIKSENPIYILVTLDYSFLTNDLEDISITSNSIFLGYFFEQNEF